MSRFFFALGLVVFFEFVVARVEVRAEETILLTAFEPFDGRPVNLSQKVAEEIKKKLAVSGAQVRIEICVLPSVYDEAAHVAQKCYEKINPKPKSVISLGEGGCEIDLETAAHNLDDTPDFPDNKGQIREARRIIEGAPDSIGFTLPVAQMYCSLPPERRGRVDPSSSTGEYVCNNTAFRLASFFRKSSVKYGFIHVPNSEFCSKEEKDPGINAGLIADMIRLNLLVKPANRRVSSTNEQCQARSPASLKELEELLALLESEKGQDCQRAFYKLLKARMLESEGGIH